VAADPSGYGRVIQNDEGGVVAIREHRDASPEELAITLCNGGVMAFRHPDIASVLDRIGKHNAKQEFYLTDAVEIMLGDGCDVSVVTCAEEEVLGINDRVQLAEAERVFQARARKAAMQSGATLIAPEAVWFSHDTVLGRDVLVEPHVYFGPGVTVGDGVTIRTSSRLEGAAVGAGAVVGPFACLGLGSTVDENEETGSFVQRGD